MEGNLRRDSPAAGFADLRAQGCSNELSRLNSDSSDLTVENSKDWLHKVEDSTTSGLRLAWTNEKHNRYLDHLESSFVEHLHQSTGLLAWCSGHDPKGLYFSRRLLLVDAPKTSEQLDLVQDGCLQKIDLRRSQHILNHEADSLVVLKSHFRCAGKRHFVRSAKQQDNNVLLARNTSAGGKRKFSNEPGTSSEHIAASDEDWLARIGEFSDQNFVDEAKEEMSATTVSKRSKAVLPEASSKDQIVPVGKFLPTETSTLNHVPPQEEDEEADQEWIRTPDIGSFLRES